MARGLQSGCFRLTARWARPEIDLQEGGFRYGNVNPNNTGAASLHTASGQTLETQYDAGTNLSAGFHTFGLDWQPGQSLTYFLDGKQVAQYTQGVPNVPMELIIDNCVGNQTSSGWRTAYDSTTPDPLVTTIAGVQIYQHAGETITGGHIYADNVTGTGSTGTGTGSTGTGTGSTGTGTGSTGTDTGSTGTGTGSTGTGAGSTGTGSGSTWRHWARHRRWG